jgi:hypothetical protein
MDHVVWSIVCVAFKQNGSYQICISVLWDQNQVSHSFVIFCHLQPNFQSSTKKLQEYQVFHKKYFQWTNQGLGEQTFNLIRPLYVFDN